MLNRNCARAVGAAALLMVLGAPAALAANNDGEVAVGGEWILTVRFPASGMSIKERADAVTERLNTILADPNLRPSDIRAVAVGKNEAKIMVKDNLLVTVEPRTARYNSTTPLALARVWAAHLRIVLPKINVKPNPSNIEAGQEQNRNPGK